MTKINNVFKCVKGTFHTQKKQGRKTEGKKNLQKIIQRKA